MTAVRTEELEEERRFLLASLADLERERAAGDVDEADYHTLRDGYVARAAVVLRALEGAAQRQPERRARSRRVAAWVAATLAAAVVAGWALSQWSGQRLTGQTMTGGRPEDEVVAKLGDARQLLPEGELAGALALYQDVLEADPGNVEALAYSGWVLVLQGGDVTGAVRDEGLVDAGLAALRRAMDLDPGYADAPCLLAAALATFTRPVDAASARAAGERCFANDPPAAVRRLAEQQLALLDRDASAVTVPSPSTTG